MFIAVTLSSLPHFYCCSYLLSFCLSAETDGGMETEEQNVYPPPNRLGHELTACSLYKELAHLLNPKQIKLSQQLGLRRDGEQIGRAHV